MNKAFILMLSCLESVLKQHVSNRYHKDAIKKKSLLPWLLISKFLKLCLCNLGVSDIEKCTQNKIKQFFLLNISE